MNRFNYTSIKSIFPYISRIEYEEDYVLELAYQAYETMMGRKSFSYDQKVCLVQVKNHKAELPKGWRLIESVAYMFSQPTEDEIDILCAAVEESNDEESPAVNPDYDYNADDIARIQHQGIVNNYNLYEHLWSSDFYKNAFVLLRPLDKPHTTSYHCTYCPNLSSLCEETYNITSDNNLITSIQDGWLCVAYLADSMDEDGYPLVIDHPDVMNAMVAYVMYKLWETKLMVDGDRSIAYRLYRDYLNKWERLAMKVRGNMNLQNIDHVGLSAYQERYKRFTSNGSNFNNLRGAVV